MAGEEASIRVSNADINRRVDNLEQAVHSLEESQNQLSRQVDRLELGQAHLKEIIDARFSTMDQSNKAINSQLDLVLEKIDKANDSIQKQAVDNQRFLSDPTASPAGQALSQEIKGLDDGRKANLTRIEVLERRMFMAIGGLTVAIFFINLIVPVLSKLIGIP